MRRSTRRAVTHLGLFISAIIFIAYLGSHGSNYDAFAWNTIRYQTAASVLPRANGVCPGLRDSSKPALVVSHVTNDSSTDWLGPLKNKYHSCVYEVDDQPNTATELRVPANRGNEAMAYLTFIIDNYADVPAAGAVFVHGSRWAWHNDDPDYDNANLLRRLDIQAALEPHGYHNMRCDWSTSTCMKSAAPQGSLQVQANARLSPWDARTASDAAIPGALAAIFGGSSAIGEKLRLGRADVLRSQCCAQFVVARSSIWRHTRDEYIALRQWLLDEDSAPKDDRVAGRIMSYLWHILFIQPQDVSDGADGIDLAKLNAQACPTAADCYCRLYGKCNLKGCLDPGCRGQYKVPPKLRLPTDWAETHSSEKSDL